MSGFDEVVEQVEVIWLEVEDFTAAIRPDAWGRLHELLDDLEAAAARLRALVSRWS